MSINPKPQLRDKFKNDLNKLIERPVDHLFKTCVNCDHWNEKEEKCNKYNARPPARVIVFGCEAYCDDDQIPF